MSIRLSPTPEAVKRLKIVDKGCFTTMGYITEDHDGQMWQVSKGPLQDFDTGKWWTDHDVTPVNTVDQWLLFNCAGSAAKGGVDCLQAGSYQLREWAAQLAEARATSKVIEVRV